MSKRIRSLILVAAAVILLVGGVLALRFLPDTSGGDGETTATTAPTLAALIDKKDAVQSVTVALADETFTVQANADGVYGVAAYDGLPQDAAAVDALRAAVGTIRPSAVIKTAATAEDLTACGLDTPRASVAVTYTDGTEFSFELGTADYATGSGAYFRKTGSAAVYLMDDTFVSTVTAGSLSYLSTKLFDAPAVNADDTTGKATLMKLTLTGSSRRAPVTVRYRTAEDDEKLSLSSTYTVTEPYYRTSDSQITNTWETGLTALTAYAVAAVHPTADALADYGLATPFSSAKLVLAVYNEGTDGAAPTTYNAVNYTVHLGKQDDEGNYYMMADGIDVVYTVAPSNVPWATLDYGDLIADYLFLRYITDLKGMTVAVNGAATTVDFTHGKTEGGADTLAASVNGVAYGETETRSLYQTMMLIHRLEETDDAPTGEAALTLTLLPQSGAAETIALYPYSANRYLCRQPDGDTYLVKASEVESAITAFQTYLSTAKAE